uniref:Uncharacterized protein n=1 Tax=Avena sativa TaxID=4498 RepID=A0ACD5W1R0_AVESA
MCGLLPRMEHLNDWDLQAVVRSCSGFVSDDRPGPPPPPPAAPLAEAVVKREPREVARSSAAAAKDASLYDLEYLDLDHKPFLLSTTPSSQAWAAADDRHEVMISFPAAASTSGVRPRVPPGRKPGIRSTTPRPKRSKKSQLKKVVCEVPVADGGVSSDLWAWRKYGQKPIKGSPYPRGYYKCSSMKGCMARKLVERSPAKPGVLVITYMAEHCHPVPTQINALAGTTRHKSTPAEDNPTTSPKGHDKAGGNALEEAAVKCEDESNETASMAVDDMAAADDENEFWPSGLDLDEFLAPVDGDLDHVLDEDGVLGRRLSL